MVAGSAIASAARRLIGTPFHFGGRVEGVGIDCAGVIVLSHRAVGLPIDDIASYSKAAILRGAIAKQLANTHDEVEHGQTGDVALFSIDHRATKTHCGVVVGQNRIVHSVANAGVSDTAIPEEWIENAVYMRHREVTS